MSVGSREAEVCQAMVCSSAYDRRAPCCWSGSAAALSALADVVKSAARAALSAPHVAVRCLCPCRSSSSSSLQHRVGGRLIRKAGVCASSFAMSCSRCAELQSQYDEFQSQSRELESELESELQAAHAAQAAAKAKLDKVRAKWMSGWTGKWRLRAAAARTVE